MKKPTVREKVDKEIGESVDILHKLNIDDVSQAGEDDREENSGTKNLLILIGIVVVAFAIFLITAQVIKNQGPKVVTIDELHVMNLQGELGPDEGYMYNGYSFVKFAGQWYTQLQQGDTIYDLGFNHDPKSVAKIPVEGNLDSDYLSNKTLYITFDPTGYDLSHIAQANFGLSRSLASAFGFNLIATCTKNETRACMSAGVVACDRGEDEDKSIVFLKEANETKIILDRNCVTVQGREKGIVKAKDRLLLRWYGILDTTNVALN